ncbi:MAG TPA: hypothetical protein VF044_02525 [Actinomycetota bacterium]
MVTGTTDRRPGNPRLRTLASICSILLALTFALGQAGPAIAGADELAADDPGAPTEEVAPPADDGPEATGDPTAPEATGDPTAPEPTDAPEGPLASEAPAAPPDGAPGPATAGPPAPPRTDASIGPAAEFAPLALDPGEISLDFVAAGPYTYDHATGVGGIYGDRTISATEGVVESLEGGDFACGDLVVFLTAITAGEGAGDGAVDVSYVFAGRTTSGDPVGFDDLVSATIAPNPPDTGNTGDGDEAATIRSETTGPDDEVLATVRVSGVEDGEQVILRLVVRLGCQPTDRVTGNVQSSIASAEVPGVGPVNVGTQTIPLKQAGEIVVPPAPIGIAIEKDGPALAHVGDTVTYTFEVRSTTPVPLGDVVVTDPACDAAPTLVARDGGDQDAMLEQGEVWRYTCSHVVTAEDPDPLPNTATVEGTADDGRTASDRDDHEVDLIHPAIRIVKTVTPASGSPGDVVTYRYAVTNVGDTTLFDVSVDDDVLGHIGDVAVLEPGETAVLTADYVLPDDAAAVVNVGVAEGEDELGEEVADDDDADVTVVLGGGPTPTPPPTPPTAFTGSDAGRAAAIAGGLLLLGTIAVLLARRREERVA